jgi:hypothetical protein
VRLLSVPSCLWFEVTNAGIAAGCWRFAKAINPATVGGRSLVVRWILLLRLELRLCLCLVHMENFELLFRLRHVSKVRLWKNTLWLVRLHCARDLWKYTSARLWVYKSIGLCLSLGLALDLLLSGWIVLSVQKGLSDFSAAFVLCMWKNGSAAAQACWHLVLGAWRLICLATWRGRSDDSVWCFFFATPLLQLCPRLLLMLFHRGKASNTKLLCLLCKCSWLHSLFLSVASRLSLRWLKSLFTCRVSNVKRWRPLLVVSLHL